MGSHEPTIGRRVGEHVREKEFELEVVLTRLREAEAKYSGLFENACEGIFQTTPEGRYLNANPALARMLGYASPAELIASITDISQQVCVRPSTRDAFRQRLEHDGFVRDFENEIYRKDGSIIWTKVNARVVNDSAGKVLYYEGTCQDVTERHHAEAQLATLAHAVESTSEMICITDLEDRFTFVNRAFALAYGYSADEILGRTPDMLLSSKNPPEVLTEILEQTRRGGWRGEVIDRRKDGTDFPIYLCTSQIRDQNGNLFGLMGIAQDITVRKETEAALQAAQKKLQAHAEDLEAIVTQRTAELREMVAELQHVSYAMVHDMRAPLRAMRSFAEMLADPREDHDDSELHGYPRRIAAAAARLDRLITDALNYTKVLHEKLPVERVDIAELIRGLIESYPNLRPEVVEIRLHEPLPAVLGSESLLTQCFSNLLGNAAKFVAPGTHPRVHIRAEPVTPAERLPASSETQGSSRLVRVWVEDNGIGIPGGVHYRLFGIFQRFNEQYEGTGIGLAIVRKVTERMGGSVGVVSEEGKGSRFWVQLRDAGT